MITLGLESPNIHTIKISETKNISKKNIFKFNQPVVMALASHEKLLYIFESKTNKLVSIDVDYPLGINTVPFIFADDSFGIRLDLATIFAEFNEPGLEIISPEDSSDLYFLTKGREKIYRLSPQSGQLKLIGQTKQLPVHPELKNYLHFKAAGSSSKGNLQYSYAQTSSGKLIFYVTDLLFFDSSFIKEIEISEEVTSVAVTDGGTTAFVATKSRGLILVDLKNGVEIGSQVLGSSGQVDQVLVNDNGVVIYVQPFGPRTRVHVVRVVPLQTISHQSGLGERLNDVAQSDSLSSEDSARIEKKLKALGIRIPESKKNAPNNSSGSKHGVLWRLWQGTGGVVLRVFSGNRKADATQINIKSSEKTDYEPEKLPEIQASEESESQNSLLGKELSTQFDDIAKAIALIRDALSALDKKMKPTMVLLEDYTKLSGVKLTVNIIPALSTDMEYANRIFGLSVENFSKILKLELDLEKYILETNQNRAQLLASHDQTVDPQTRINLENQMDDISIRLDALTKCRDQLFVFKQSLLLSKTVSSGIITKLDELKRALQTHVAVQHPETYSDEQLHILIMKISGMTRGQDESSPE